MKRLHYAWVVAAVGFVTLITAAGFRSTSGVLIVPLQEEFGWSRSMLGFAVFVNLMLFGLCGPFAAALAERYGLKRVMMLALLAVSAGSSLTRKTTNEAKEARRSVPTLGRGGQGVSGSG